jgi:alpha-1,2-mannosyltransferase
MREFLEGLSPSAPLARFERVGLCIIAVAFIVFSLITVDREALQNWHKGDLGVYLRAAWAVRIGANPYHATDNHGWHYLYPPLLAVLLVPLADPPPSRGPIAPNVHSVLPYWVSAAIWYWFSVGCLLASLHVVASNLEEHLTTGGLPPWPRHARGWWALRILPLLVVLFYVGDGLGRGQATPIVMLCLAGCSSALLRRTSGKAGLWLGFAAALKLFPVYLLIYPVWRFDRWFLTGAALTILIGLAFPFAFMGPKAGFVAYRSFVRDRLVGESSGGGSPTVAPELHGTGTSIQSFEYMIYQSLDPDGDDLLPVPPPVYFAVHIAFSISLTMIALLAMRHRTDPLGELLFFGALMQLMIPILPVSRPHYYAIGALTSAALLAHQWSRRRGLWSGWPTVSVLFANAAVGLADALGQPQALQFGLATYAALALGGVALISGRDRVLAKAPI